jgi:2-dehydro-3-deoxyphosphogluconate aldolase/(4S)-4-hydroxy-2-oxoglutarate aldolase
MIPGCGSSTEIVSQFGLGANLCKLFPAKIVGGPEFISALDPAIHKAISIVPTGGTDTTNIDDYIGVGVLVLGASFSMIDRPTLVTITENQDYVLLARELKRIKALIDDCRREKWPKIDFSNADAASISRATGRLFNLSRGKD